MSEREQPWSDAGEQHGRILVLSDNPIARSIAAIASLHVPAGHDLGGKGAGEIALSVVAEIVAEGYGRRGGAMRD